MDPESDLREKRYKLLWSSPILRELQLLEIQRLYAIGKLVSLRSGEFLIKQGEKEHELFILLEGSLEIIRSDLIRTSPSFAEKIAPGAIVGEIAFLDHGERSASIIASMNSELLCVSFDAFERFIQESSKPMDILVRLSEDLGKKLRKTIDPTFVSVKNQLLESKNRSLLGSLTIGLIAIISLLPYGFFVFTSLLKSFSDPLYTRLILTLVMTFNLYLMVHFFHVPLSEFQIFGKNWKKAVIDGFFLMLPVAIAILCAAYSSAIREFLINSFASFEFSEKLLPYPFLMQFFIYSFLIIPLEELFVRVSLQGVLEKLLPKDRRIWLSIFISNLVYSSFHVWLSVYFAIGLFVFGIYLGWIYSRTHNILGPWVAHVILWITSSVILYY